MFSLLPLRLLYFLCYVEVYLNSKLKRKFSKNNDNNNSKKIPKNFKSILCQMDKCNLFLSTNVLLFDFFTISIHRFVGWTYILRGSLFIKLKQHVICYTATQSSI